MSAYVNPLHPAPSNGQRSQFSALGGALAPLQPSQTPNIQANRGSSNDPKAAAASKRSGGHSSSRGQNSNHL
ncbi:hypothetical protein EUX98_g4301 [Antrodiella citrinella]|uniref:Uncharacterized protein n=1 Tax=Antrodiella citrinella TaxID=2447956 RepID=A0A4S4MUA2_9APHY|nr:hypothetical protein EUX98_g4301 [Antrodiella citrinella]